MNRLSRLLLGALLFVSASGGSVAWGHEGHDHGAPPPAVTIPIAARAEASTEQFELVAVEREGRLIIWLDRFATNEPVIGAVIEAETPKGSLAAEPQSDGTYALAAPWASQPGKYDLIFTVAADNQVDVLALTLIVPAAATSQAAAPSARASVTELVRRLVGRVGDSELALATGAGGFLIGLALLPLVRRRRSSVAVLALLGALSVASPATADSAQFASARGAPVRDMAQRLPEGGIFVPKSAQRILAIRTIMTAQAVHKRTVELPGRIIADPNASGYVQTSLGGRLSPPQGGFPRLGTSVKRGDVLAYVAPSVQTIDVSDMRQRQGELDQQIAIVERRSPASSSLSARARSRARNLRTRAASSKASAIAGWHSTRSAESRKR